MAESYAGVLRDSVVMKGIEGVTVLGPSPAFLHRLRGEYRWSLTIKGQDLGPVKELLPDGRGFLGEPEILNAHELVSLLLDGLLVQPPNSPESPRADSTAP